jgi:hypothetical protein
MGISLGTRPLGLIQNIMKKYYRLIIGVVILVVILGYLGINYAIVNVLPYSAIRPSRCTKEDLIKYNSGIISPKDVGLNWTDFNITVEGTIKLKGWFVYSNQNQAKGTIFLLHGIASCKATMLSTAELLASNGFNCVLYDSRTNGESGGINCTFGFYEKGDLSLYIDSTIARFPNSAPYGVFGNSLGAAVAIQTMAIDKRIVCGIAESPFANLREVIHDYFARMILLHINYIPDAALKYTEKIAHFKVDSVQPVLAAKYITQPIMIVHGLADKHISPIYGKEVFDNLKSKDKIWYPIENGTHYNLALVGGEELKNRIIKFYDNNMVKP